MPDRVPLAEYVELVNAADARVEQTFAVLAAARARGRLGAADMAAWHQLNKEHVGRVLRLLDLLASEGATFRDERGNPILVPRPRSRCFIGIPGCPPSNEEARRAAPALEIDPGVESSLSVDIARDIPAMDPVTLGIVVAGIVVSLLGMTYVLGRIYVRARETDWDQCLEEIRVRAELGLPVGDLPEAPSSGGGFLGFLKTVPWIAAGLIGLYLGGRFLLDRYGRPAAAPRTAMGRWR